MNAIAATAMPSTSFAARLEDPCVTLSREWLGFDVATNQLLFGSDDDYDVRGALQADRVDQLIDTPATTLEGVALKLAVGLALEVAEIEPADMMAFGEHFEAALMKIMDSPNVGVEEALLASALCDLQRFLR